jgi:hypothetical protein
MYFWDLSEVCLGLSRLVLQRQQPLLWRVRVYFGHLQAMHLGLSWYVLSTPLMRVKMTNDA